MLEEIKLLLGLDASKDSLISLLIRQATEDAKTYTGSDDITPIAMVIERMVVFLYNRLGTEGLESETYTGATYHYTDDYPEYITSLLDNYKESIGGKCILRTY